MSSNNILEPLVDSLIGASGLLFKAAYMGFDVLGDIMYRLIEGKPFEVSTECMEEEEGVNIENIIKYKYEPVESLVNINKTKNLINYEYVEGEKEGVKVCIGYDMEGEKVWFNMLDSHAIVGGASRWGKSSFLNVFITSVMLTYTENEVMFLGCDFKRSDVYYYRNFKHFRGMAVNTEQFMAHMRALEKEAIKRSEILDISNCRNVVKYNKIADTKLSYIIYVIDELPQLVIDSDCKEKLHLAMSKYASYGIYFMLATQDCAKPTIGRCKMNCSQTIGFHTRDQTDSETLIGKGYNLQNISVKGRCKFDNGAEVVETQIFFLEEEEIERLLKDKRK